MKLLSGITPEKYTLKTDQEVTLTLKPLSSAERIDILASINDARKYGQAMLAACEYAITGWKGVKDDTGADVEFSVSRVKEIPVDAMIEVSNHILKLSAASPDEKKTSGLQSPS